MTEIFKITSGCCFIVYMLLGFFILILDYKSPLNRNFFYFTALLALWSLGHFLSFLTPFEAQKELYQRLYYIPGSFFPFFILKFILILTHNYNKKFIKVFMNTVVWIFPLFTSYISITSNAIANTAPFSWWFYFNFQCCVFNFISIVILIRRRQITKINREKKQATILINAGIITIILSWIVDFLAGMYQLEPISSTINLFLVISLIYAMTQYRFMQLSAPHVCEEIIANIHESIILLDNHFKIITANPCIEEILNRNKYTLLNQDISGLVWEHEEFIRELHQLFTGESGDFSSRIHFVRKDGTKTLMDVKCSIIRDKYHDIIGILIIGNEVQEMQQLKELNNITDREAEVIHHIINGQVNREIAGHLGVTERTIKSHITNIYSKLNVDNKIQLMILLKNFKLLPEKKAKQIFIFRKK
ncbi:MAG: PAS domain-containing protein [Spirochaetales bacterium]|nr:PAS domain-containing protein [Spirochaetales bacterium]